MDFRRQQRDPMRHMVGITFVVLLHALIIYALMTGLGRKMVEVIKKPLDAKIIEEIKAPPPPPPPPKIVQQARPQAEAQPYVPPPDIPVQSAPSDAPTITAVTAEPPKETYVIAPPPPPAVVAPPAPPAPPKPAVRRIVSRVSGDNPTYPREAIKAGVTKGRVVARIQIDEKGNVIDIQFTVSEPPRVFERAVRSVLQDWKLNAEGEKYYGEVEFNFTLKDD
jgi:protein TonB